MTAPRRLAAILAADVVGYSRLMGADEAGTARAHCERRDGGDAMAQPPDTKGAKTAARTERPRS